MSMATTVKSEWVCRYCKKPFRKESTLAVHMCEPKRRAKQEKDTGVQLGLQAYMRFYEVTQGSAKFKTYEDFSKSPYYKAFVKFGWHVKAIRAVNPTEFINWVIVNNKKIDHWCREKIYTEYLHDYLRKESYEDAITRAVDYSEEWSEKTGHPAKDFLRYGNGNTVCHAVLNGRISPWILYNTDSGVEFLSKLDPEQIKLIWDIINTDFWQKKFQTYMADAEIVREVLTQEGW